VLVAALRHFIPVGPAWDQYPLQMRQNNPAIPCAGLLREKFKLKDVPDHLRYTHRGLAFWCVARDYITADDCSACFDDEFLRRRIERNERKWTQLPTKLRTDASFAKSISSRDKNLYRDMDVVRDILASIHTLGDDASFWRSHNFPYNFMKEFAPIQLLTNRALMLEACAANAPIFRHLDASLQHDYDFLLALLAKNVAVLLYLDHQTRLYPEFVKNQLGALAKNQLGPLRASAYRVDSTIRLVADAIEPSFWRNYEFIMAWVSAGFGFGFPRAAASDWVRDRNIALISATHYLGKLEECQFDPSHAFRGDCDFMIQVLECHPHLWSTTVGEARSDPWVLTVALASSAEFAKSLLLDWHLNGKDNDIDTICRFIRDRFSAIDTFTRLILGNMLSTESIEDTGSNLTMLNQSIETSLEFKKSLA
jgi:hypothetical protein